MFSVYFVWQRLQDLPFFTRRLFREMMDPQRTLPLIFRARMIFAVSFLTKTKERNLQSQSTIKWTLFPFCLVIFLIFLISWCVIYGQSQKKRNVFQYSVFNLWRIIWFKFCRWHWVQFMFWARSISYQKVNLWWIVFIFNTLDSAIEWFFKWYIIFGRQKNASHNVLTQLCFACPLQNHCIYCSVTLC